HGGLTPVVVVGEGVGEGEENIRPAPPSAARVREDAWREDFERAWRGYPRRPNNPKAKAWKAYRARRQAGVSVEELNDGVTSYDGFCARERVEPRFVKQGATFFGPNRQWAEDYTSPAQRSA